MLTPTQLATLKTAIIADPVAGLMRTLGDTVSLQAWCNAPSTTLAWRIAVSAQESDEAATYTTYDALVQGKRDSWLVFLRFSRDLSKAKIRNWIADIWGAATAGSISEAVLQAGTEFASNAQNVFGGASGSKGTVTAIKRTFDGQISGAEVNILVN